MEDENMEDEIICYCSNISKEIIVNAIHQGATTLEKIRLTTSACTLGKCKELSPRKRCCSKEIVELLNE
ncbi:NAD(P)H-nitrite reductase large subunit [Aequitasia blattaphilus]|uniref:(2Fe-2S)-binding protein n=1 Tax=Aequitasia blattaphilus TaxID=2949332 RepID=A0ABT1E8U0_9FIRM|nr:(2Fe-2S)-binding protein [Aequitasia blattaphilus]MCP1102235.1 (2Fe-2S)-binding protein [Aequitasia blattaphilus]MCR8614875.1 (2Fe-2S)-binding protein [Aequitasia blattaphilus]